MKKPPVGPTAETVTDLTYAKMATIQTKPQKKQPEGHRMEKNIQPKPTPNEIEELTVFLLSLPFVMRMLTHDTIAGHVMYVHGSPIVEATAKWMARQNKKTWEEMIKEWGGHDAFFEIQRQIVDTVFKGFFEAVNNNKKPTNQKTNQGGTE